MTRRQGARLTVAPFPQASLRASPSPNFPSLPNHMPHPMTRLPSPIIHTRWATLCALILVASAGCTSYHERRDVQNPPGIDIPTSFSDQQSATQDPPAHPSKWWESFNDPSLNAAVEQALSKNLDLRVAWARLEQSRVLAKSASVGQWPTMSLDSSVGYSQSAIVIGSQTIQNNNTQYQLSIPVAYEVDLWGKVEQRTQAAALDVQAAESEVATLAMTLASQTTETWFAITEARARKNLLHTQRDINKTYLDLISARFRAGLAGLADIYQQEQQIQSIDAQLAQVDSQLETLEHSLSTLLGDPPRGANQSRVNNANLPEPPPPPAPGLPVHLLERRPDLRAARFRVEAADLRLGVAKADRLPTLRFTASVGLLGINTPNILDILTASLGAAFSWPLLDGGQRALEVERQEAAFQELLATYGGRFLTATREVEDALTQERQQRLYISRLEDQLRLSRRALDQLNERYQRGSIDYLRILTALNATQQLEVGLLSAKRQLLSYRIQLYRALGGDLSPTLNPPKAL
jgi:multidrug efflux system outer membrane protein